MTAGKDANGLEASDPLTGDVELLDRAPLCTRLPRAAALLNNAVLASDAPRISNPATLSTAAGAGSRREVRAAETNAGTLAAAAASALAAGGDRGPRAPAATA